MSLVLNGTSQYVSLGDAVDIRSATPILIAAVVDSTSFPSGTKGLWNQGDYSNSHGHGAFLYGGPPKSIGDYATPSGGSNVESDMGQVLTADNGWYLILWTFYTTGSAPNISVETKAQSYSYTDTTWSTQQTATVATGRSSTALAVPSAGETTVIGANSISGITNYFPTKISWFAVFNNDGGAAGTQIKDTSIAAELIANGFWNLLDGNCLGAWAFNATTTTTDQSSGGHNGTLIGSPTYGAAGPGETGGGTTYTEAGEAVLIAVASGADALTMTDAGQATSAAAASGADAIIFTEAGGAVSAWTAGGADAWTMADAGQALAAWTSGALDTMLMADAGGGVLIAVASGTDGSAPAAVLPYQGDATIYDSAGATGSISGATVLATGTIYDSAGATGSTSGATIQPSETSYG